MSRFSLSTIMCAALLYGCGPSTWALTSTGRAPGTEGAVQVKTIEGGNHLVTVTLEHLPPPGTLAEGRTTYVVWFIEEGHSPVLASVLGYDEDDREGTATATTPVAAFEVLVTAEVNAQPEGPSELIVVRQSIRTNE